MKMRPIYVMTFCAVSLWNATPAASAEFFGLGQVPGGENMSVRGLSSDGSVAVVDIDEGERRTAWRWTVETGLETLGCGDGDRNCPAVGASGDGSVIVGHMWNDDSLERVPIRWTTTSGMEILATLPGYPRCSAYHVSDDGSVMVGSCGFLTPDSSSMPQVAVRWTESGIQSLGVPDPNRYTDSYVLWWSPTISSDGSVIAVRCDKWTADEPVQLLEVATWLWTEQAGYEYLVGPGQAYDMTPDGSVVIGWTFPSDHSQPAQPWRWAKETGTEILSFETSDVNEGWHLQVTPDGSVIFGGNGDPTAAFLRYDDNEIRDLRELLISEYGLASGLEGWQLHAVAAISADGRTIVGNGTNPDGNREPWMVVLDDPLVQPGDFYADRQLDALDIDELSVVVRLGTHSKRYDLTGDDLVDDDDRAMWVHELKHTYFGDANLDGEFNSSDMTQVFAAGKYETGEDAGWANGDWSGDGFFSSSDMVTAFVDGGYEKGPRPPAAAVPEPTSVLLVVMGLIGLAIFRRPRES